MSGAGCVWYRTVYMPVRRFQGKGSQSQIPRDLPSSAQLPLVRSTGPNGMQPRDDVSPVPFVLAGPDGRATLTAPNEAPVVVTTATENELLSHAGAAAHDPSATGVLGAGNGATLLLVLVPLVLVTVLVIVIAVLRH